MLKSELVKEIKDVSEIKTVGHLNGLITELKKGNLPELKEFLGETAIPDSDRKVSEVSDEFAEKLIDFATEPSEQPAQAAQPEPQAKSAGMGQGKMTEEQQLRETLKLASASNGQNLEQILLYQAQIGARMGEQAAATYAVNQAIAYSSGLQKYQQMVIDATTENVERVTALPIANYEQAQKIFSGTSEQQRFLTGQIQEIEENSAYLDPDNWKKDSGN